MNIFPTKHELPVSLVLGVTAPIYWVLELPVYASGPPHDMGYAADCINVTGKSFLMALIAWFCLANARKVKATTKWMKAWDMVLKIWLLFASGAVFLVWIPQIY